MMDSRLYTTMAVCRSCGSGPLGAVLDFGPTPLADRLVSVEALAEDDPLCPLTVVACPACGLMQIAETVRPDVLFGADYPYYSSVSGALLSHFRTSVEELLAWRPLGERSLVVEIASNDGYLLRNYRDRGIPVLGIDPAPGPARRAQALGIDTRIAFFTRDMADELVADGVAADVVHANNVLAHVADTNGFVAGIARMLKDDGVAVIEFPYVRDLVDRLEFDTIYHQHLCYFSLSAARALFARHGLVLTRVVRTPIHGGSLRVFLSRGGEGDDSVDTLLETEAKLGLDATAYYQGFADRVRALLASLRTLLDDLRASGARLAGYGAAAKACTLLSAARIDGSDLEVIVDRNPHKHGRFMPGSRIPIRAPEWLKEHRPDVTLLLAWNFAEEILAQQGDYLAGGGRFLLPLPEPSIL